MKRANQPGVGASLAGCVDFDDFTAAGRGIGLCPSANRASELKQDVTLAWLPVPQPRNCHAGSIPRHPVRRNSGSIGEVRRKVTKRVTKRSGKR